VAALCLALLALVGAVVTVELDPQRAPVIVTAPRWVFYALGTAQPLPILAAAVYAYKFGKAARRLSRARGIETWSSVAGWAATWVGFFIALAAVLYEILNILVLLLNVSAGSGSGVWCVGASGELC
jgi:hypothetical protein